MLKINSKNFTVTSAMREAIDKQFSFLTEEELNYLKLHLERLNSHTLRIKVIFQKPKHSVQAIEVLTKDFYKGLDGLAKKLKVQLNRQEMRRRHRQHKVGLGQAFEQELTQEKQASTLTPEGDVTSELNVPIYNMTMEEAIEQLNCFNYNVLIYTDSLENSLCVLVRQPNGDIKRYIGIPV